MQVTVTVILGLGLTDLLRNYGDQYRHRNEREVYWLQIAASSLLLLVILAYLWYLWLASSVVWTLPLFMLQVASAGALALSAQFIKIDCSSDKTAKTQYFENCVATYVTWCTAPLFVGAFFAVSITGSPPTIRIIVALVLFSLAIIKKPVFHIAVVSLLLMILIYGVTLVQPQLQ